MGEELIPCPLLRLPCMFHEDARYRHNWKKTCCVGLLQIDELHMVRRTRVKHLPLGIARIVTTLLVSMLMLFYFLYVEKAYLEKSDIQGFSRVTLQHPVLNHCNPIHEGCRANFKPLSELAYCNGSNLIHDLGGNEHSLRCRYYDEYDIFAFDTGTDLGNILIPTRISYFYQQVHPSCENHRNCAHPYTLLHDEHFFVANIEDYTLLFDHGYISPSIPEKAQCWNMPGMVKNCLTLEQAHEEGFTISEEMKHLYRENFEEECPKEMIGCGEGINLTKCPAWNRNEQEKAKIMEGYDAEEETHGTIFTIPAGDVFRVGDVLRLAGINVDKRREDHHNCTVRYEGEAIDVRIKYINYTEKHMPNSLPPVYEYDIRSLKTESYKMTSIKELSNGTRVVQDVHGIWLSTTVVGNMGRATFFKGSLMLLECIAAAGIVQWFFSCLAFNMRPGKEGDDLFYHVHEEAQRKPVNVCRTCNLVCDEKAKLKERCKCTKPDPVMKKTWEIQTASGVFRYPSYKKGKATTRNSSPRDEEGYQTMTDESESEVERDPRNLGRGLEMVSCCRA